MPAMSIRRTLTALERNVDLFEKWQYRIAPWRGMVRFGIHCTGAVAGQDLAMFIGSDNIVEQSAISIGATDGVMPNPQTVPFYEFIVNPGDQISTKINELGNVATTDLMYFVAIDPI